MGGEGRSAASVSEVIRRAFAGVTLGAGVGLHEAQGIDGYASEQECAELRAGDEKQAWSAIDADDLNRCYTSPCFFDAEGMRFHLPAYMLADLAGRFGYDFPFHLTQSTQLETQMALLDDAQREAVRLYLSCVMADDGRGSGREHIRRALDGYWAR